VSPSVTLVNCAEMDELIISINVVVVIVIIVVTNKQFYLKKNIFSNMFKHVDYARQAPSYLAVEVCPLILLLLLLTLLMCNNSVFSHWFLARMVVPVRQ